MVVHDTYGTRTHTPADLARIIADHLDLTLVERDSYYRGSYFLADAPPYELEVQPNAIPGDDDENDLYDPDHPEARTLLLVTGPHRDTTLDAALSSVDALVLLTREPS
ncbi:hypothetical protein [Catellatospora vulcania]|uniref:hypothetical protein n=1 Tax=Catellatospora vulcania TaxID=1460450 RepID=UPI0012D4B40A|nr:hypothetical protein [Catellatospora vulcania]